MSRFIFLVIIALLALFGYYSIYWLKGSYKILPIKQAKKVDNVPFSDWHDFKAPSGKFNVRLPVLPQHATQTIVDPKTKLPRFYDMYVAQGNNGTIFMVSLIKFPEGFKESPEFLQKTIVSDMVASNPQNQLKNMKISQFQKQQALDFTIENSEMTVAGKTFMKGPILYLLSGIFNKEAFEPAEYDFFINSFDLPSIAAQNNAETLPSNK